MMIFPHSTPLKVVLGHRISQLPAWVAGALLAFGGCSAESTNIDPLEAGTGSDEVEEDSGEVTDGDTDGLGFDETLDEFVSEVDPAEACVSCGLQYYFSCSSDGWALACPPGSYNLGPIDAFCASCADTICLPTPASGTVDASPEQVDVVDTLGCTSIQWDSCGQAQVWVSHNGAPETLFAQDSSGSQNACWIQAGHDYEFCLYEGLGHSNQLDCVTVQGVQVDPPDPPGNPCNSCPSGQSCHCEPFVCWPNNLQCP